MDSEVLSAVAVVLASTGPQPVLPGFLNSLAGPLEQYGLWAILLLVFLEDFGIPVPGETVLIAGAIFAGSGRLNVVAVAVVGFAAAVFGDNVGYAIGRFGGRVLVERWGRYVFLTPKRVNAAEAFFLRHGAKIIVIARFIEGLRQANGIIAGITQMHWLKFFVFNALGAALWVGTWVCAGYFAGHHITTIYHYITTYSLYAAIAAVVLIAAWVVYRVRKRRRSRAATAAAEAEAETATESEAAAHAETAADSETHAEAETAAEAEAAAQAETPAEAEAAAEPPGAAANGQAQMTGKAHEADYDSERS